MANAKPVLQAPASGRDPIDHFTFELLRAAGLDALPEEARVEFALRLRGEVQRRIGAIALQHLDDAAMTEYAALLERKPAPDPSAVQVFLAAKIPEFEQKVQAGLQTFAQEFVGAAKKGVA